MCVNFFGTIFVVLFSGTLGPTKLNLGTHVDNGYRVYQNQAAAAYSSLYFFIFLSLHFSYIKHFRHIFLRNCYAYKIETRYTRGQWVDVRCISELGFCCIFVPFFLHFSSLQFSNIKIFVALFSGTVKPTKLKLGTHVDNG